MVDLFESRLDSAGSVPVDDPRVSEALQAVVADRAAAAKAPRRRRMIPAISIGLTVALLGAGAAAASQWAPWTYVPEPDLVISRDWTDVHGNFLGSCETHFAVSTLSGDKRVAAQRFLAGLNVDSLEPDAERVASTLVAVGRGDEIGDLVQGAKLTDLEEVAPALTGYFLNRTTDAEDVADLLGETLTEAWRVSRRMPKEHEAARMWVFGIARNTLRHHMRGQTRRDALVPTLGSVFTKFISSMTGPNATVNLPEGNVDWEVELAVVIGRTAKGISAADAWDHVAGLTVAQDLSERD